MKNAKASWSIFFLWLLTLISIRAFSFVFIPDRIFDYIEFFTLTITIIIYIKSLKNRKANKYIFKPYVNAILILTLISSIPANIFHNQSIFLSFLASRTILYWLLYFIIENVPENNLTNLITVIGVIWSLIVIIQQLTFPKIWFNSPNAYYDYFSDIEPSTVVNHAQEEAGVIRIMLLGIPYAYFAIFYSWIKLKYSITPKHLFIFLIAIVALSLTGSRQIVFSIILIFGVDFIVSKYSSGYKKLIVSFIFTIILLSARPLVNNYLSSLVRETQEQNITSSKYIRIREADFFLFKFYPNWICYLFGNGWEHSLSPYGIKIENNIYYRSDVGLIGALNKFGLFYVLAIFIIFIKVLIPSKKVSVPQNIRLLFIFLLLTSFTGVNYFETTENIPLFTYIFYIIDKRSEKYRYSHPNLQ
jgi:hypothetical protein